MEVFREARQLSSGGDNHDDWDDDGDDNDGDKDEDDDDHIFSSMMTMSDTKAL